MKSLETVGKVALVVGAAGFVGEMFVPAIKQYGGMIKMLIVGGAVAFLVGYFL